MQTPHVIQDLEKMNAQNPYSPPEVIETLFPDGNPQFGDMDDKAFNKLYYRSCNVTAIAVLLSLGFLVLSLLTLAPDEKLNQSKPILMGLALLYLIALIGIIKRTSWGRIMGILACVPMLASIPIGTLIGLAGIFAFAKAPNLFGPARLRHKDLKAEFNLRKQAKKAAKRKPAGA